ncbi:MAG: hypothetical protein SOV54_01815 [Faecalibacterium prausnitzii]|nr:hypothetical protein [Faecalibacterium prausnitzii]MDD7152965.1 hypothetical protein [Faecalibacterium prausnitzii]MDY2681476.1 hypothetical protein [Faecalibacterium prausnitzii]
MARRSHGFSRRRSRWKRRLLLAGLVAVLAFLLYSCGVQRMVYSARGTLIFLPDLPCG